MELKKIGKFSHYLFMDGDVSYEVEGIKRTINLSRIYKKF